MSSGTKLDRKESYKAQRKNYRYVFTHTTHTTKQLGLDFTRGKIYGRHCTVEKLKLKYLLFCRKEKKRVEKELLSTFKDESIIVLADWLKIRGSLKGINKWPIYTLLLGFVFL